MSSILQLQISGVRAFDNHDSQHLTFASPLTLICGQNGVGKTTIIECLRYVTTGDLPPNVKGGAFVHDPRMSAASEVFAQVKLLFRSVNGAKMVATRSMRLNLSAGNKLTFKTLEGTVKEQTDANDGSLMAPASVSARYADLNLQVPLLLGVPPAILNYVVFCHQEESLWPFAEPSAVKKRFDDIFEATKYTKALDSLKVVRKDYMANIRVETKDVEHLEEDKRRVSEKEQQLTDLQTRLSDLGAEAADLQQQRVDKSNELNAAVEHKQTVQRLEYVVTDVSKQASRSEEDAKQLKGDLRELLTAPTKKIEEELHNSDARQSELGAELDSKSKALARYNESLNNIHQNLAALDNQQGRLEQLIESQQARHTKRWKLIGKSPDTANRDEDEISAVKTWREAQEAALNQLTSELESLEVSNRQHELQLSQLVSSAEAKHLQLLQTIGTEKRAAKENMDEESDLVAQINELKRGSIDYVKQQQTMQQRLESLEEETQLALQEFQNYTKEDRLGAALRTVTEAESRAESARNTLTEVIDVSKRLSQLHHFKDRQNELQGSLLMRANKELQENAFQLMAPNTSAPNTTAVRESLEQLKRKLEELQTQVKQTETHLQIATENLKTAESRQRRFQADITKLSLSPEVIKNYENDLLRAENALIEATEEQEQLSFAHKYFERALLRAEQDDNPACLLCEHQKTPAEAQKLVRILQAKISALSITPEQAQALTDTKRQELESLRKLAPRIEQMKRLNQNIDSCNEEIEQLNTSIATLKSDLHSARSTSGDLQSRYDEHNRTISPLLSLIERYEEELSELDAKIKLEEKMTGVTNTLMTLSEAQSQQAKADQELKATRLNADNARAEHERLKTRSNSMAQNTQELRLAISELELTSARVQQLQDQLSRTRKSRLQHEEQQRTNEQQLPSAEKKIEDTRRDLSKCKFSNAQEEKQIAEKRNALVIAVRQFDELSNEISHFYNEYGTDPLANLEQDRKSAKLKVDELNNDIRRCQSEIKHVEQLIADFTSFRRNLQDNIRLRRYESDLVDLRQKLEEAQQALEQEQQRFGTTDTDYEARIRDLQDVVGSINHTISKISGESKALQEQIQVIRHELATSYRDTAQQYEKAVAQLNSSKGAAHELAQYSAALDRSIMKYHHLKMDEINDSLDQMWKQTYTGTDIDTIMICSEPGEGLASTSGTSRTSHNYRVCMVKQDTILDMRGRCSAGQKVLASILIRMALAECFGNSSGLVVLDEPTTNLDYENINALAHSLSDIIAMRRAQSNFQLIVITHDEQFLTQMNPSSHCSFYYKISRDSRQLSTITKMPISSLA